MRRALLISSLGMAIASVTCGQKSGVYSECSAMTGVKPVAITALKLCAIKNKNAAPV